jgi:hypothetical protein
MPRRYSWISLRDRLARLWPLTMISPSFGPLLHQQQAQQRGLARAARAGEEHELALAHRDRQIAQGIQASPIKLGQAMRGDHVRRVYSQMIECFDPRVVRGFCRSLRSDAGKNSSRAASGKAAPRRFSSVAGAPALIVSTEPLTTRVRRSLELAATRVGSDRVRAKAGFPACDADLSAETSLPGGSEPTV